MGNQLFLLLADSSADASEVNIHVLLTFAGALVVGVVLIQVAHRLRISPIPVLLLGGVILGRNFLNLIRPSELGDGLPVIIALIVGIVLFEGGLSLDLKSYKSVSAEVKGIVIAGVFLTWWITALIIWFLFRYPLKFCLLLASFTVVTGPTIIGPLLKRVHVKRKLHIILHWEGVLVDPIGVFIALLCYKLVAFSGDGTTSAFMDFGTRVMIGAAIGGFGGLLLAQAIKRKLVSEDNLNIVALAAAVGIFSVADLWKHESGLLSVTIAGFVVGSHKLPELRKLRAYKAELIEMLIALLFILVAANLDFSKFSQLGWKGLLLVALVLFVVRPLVVFGATMQSDITTRDKLFLTWVCPRGLVAISMSSLFAISLSRMQGWTAMASSLEVFSFTLVAATVLFQGSTTKLVAKSLGVLKEAHTGWMIVGAHQLARDVGCYIQKQGIYVVMVDPDVRNCALSRRAGLTAVNADPVAMDRENHPECYGIGNILAVAEHDDLNTLVCQYFKTEEPDLNLYRWTDRSSGEESANDSDLHVGEVVWTVLQLSNLRALCLKENQQHTEVRKTTVEKLHHPNHVLFGKFGDQVLPFVPPDASGDCEVFIYQPFAVGIDTRIKPEWVICSDATSREAVYGELLGRLKNSYPELDIEDICTNLLRQENEFSSLVGFDVAIPHFYSDALTDSVVLLAKLKTPIKDMHSDDHVRYLFLVLSPEDQPRVHLQALSEISRFIMEEGNRKQLDEAESTEDLVGVLFE